MNHRNMNESQKLHSVKKQKQKCKLQKTTDSLPILKSSNKKARLNASYKNTNMYLKQWNDKHESQGEKGG